jgi:hypothetical protein
MTCRDDGYHSVKCNVLAGGERRKPTLETDGERFRADFVDVSDILALAWPENHGFRFRKIGGQAKAKALALLALKLRLCWLWLVGQKLRLLVGENSTLHLRSC